MNKIRVKPTEVQKTCFVVTSIENEFTLHHLQAESRL